MLTRRVVAHIEVTARDRGGKGRKRSAETSHAPCAGPHDSPLDTHGFFPARTLVDQHIRTTLRDARHKLFLEWIWNAFGRILSHSEAHRDERPAGNIDQFRRRYRRSNIGPRRLHSEGLARPA